MFGGWPVCFRVSVRSDKADKDEQDEAWPND